MPHQDNPQTGEPSAEEIAGGRQARFTAAIGANVGPAPDDLLNRLRSVYNEPLIEGSVFVFPSQLSNSRTDAYWTYMTRATLDNYVRNARDGRALMLAHNYLDLPAGQSYDGAVERDDTVRETNPDRVGLSANYVDRFFADWYIIRGLHIAEKPNDQIIAAIETRSWRDMSIGFQAEAIRCDICAQDVMSWDCPHMPGAKYPSGPAGELRRCKGAVEGGEMLEGSFGYKGATPDAAVVPVKARMIGATQALSKDEARTVMELERRVGARLVDPALLRRAARSIFTLTPGITGNPGISRGKEPEEMPVSQKKQTKPAARTAPQKRVEDAAAVTDAVATGATEQAAALAAHITELNNQAAAAQSIIDGLIAQQAALESQATEDGQPIDNTELIAGLQLQIDGQQATLDSITADVVAAQAELDAINGVAEATGGSTTEAPAPTEPPPAGEAAGTATIAAAGLRQMAATFTRFVAPIRLTGRRAVEETALEPILAAAQQLVTDLQALLTEVAPDQTVGANMARTAGDKVIFAAISRATGEKRVGLSTVRQLALDAEAGRIYRRDMIEAAVASQVRALGVEGTDAEQYRAMLANLTIPQIQAEKERYERVAKAQLDGGGRRVTSASAVRDLELRGDETEEIPPTTTEREAQINHRINGR